MAQSARGLFRATGKTTNPAAALDAGCAIVKALPPGCRLKLIDQY